MNASYIPSIAIYELRQIVRMRISLLQQRTAVISQVKSLLEGLAPGITKELKDLKGKYAQVN